MTVIGNWTIVPQYSDTISSTKNLALPDLDFADDYTVKKQTPEEVVLVNKTGSGLLPVELIRYGRQPIADVYTSGLNRSLDIAEYEKANSTSGIRAYAELATTLKATNSVSGEEVILPLRFSIAAITPTIDFVSAADFTTALKRGISTAFGTGLVDGSLMVNIVRGDLNPVDDYANADDNS